MNEIQLCDESQVFPPVVFTTPVFSLTQVRANPNIPTSSDPNGYLHEREIKRLVKAVLAHLGTDATFEVTWSPHGKGVHGETAKEVSPIGQKIGKRIAEIRKRLEVVLDESEADDLMNEAMNLAREAHAVPKDQRFVFGVHFNKDVFEAIPVDERAQTIIHEACHLAAWMLDENADRDMEDGGGHGPFWRELMRMCGCKPDAFAEAVEGVHCLAECPACHTRAGVSDEIAGVIWHGDGHAICRNCGQQLYRDNLILPKKFKVPPRMESVVCPSCGVEALMPEDILIAVKAGQGFAMCPVCGTVLGPTKTSKRGKIYGY